MMQPLRKSKGLIALDIDGTITKDILSLPPRVADYLASLTEKGWRLVFVTGRTFQFAYHVLKAIQAPYDIAVQNGAIILQMPEHKILAKKYVPASLLPELDAICHEKKTDYVIYGGFEYGDVVFYRSGYFTPQQMDYLKRRTFKFQEAWQEVSAFENIGLSAFPSIKCFGDYALANALAEEIEGHLGLHVPLIRDPFADNAYVAQGTHSEVTKGEAVRDIVKLFGPFPVVIGAGDDYNDITLLEAADIKVAMANAPQALLQMADLIAPPASEEGIIKGLTEAIGEEL